MIDDPSDNEAGFVKTTGRSMATIAALLAVGLTGCGTSGTSTSLTTATYGNNAPSSSTVAGTSSAITPQPAAPSYKILGTTHHRDDNARNNYYIAIAPVDLSNDSFKSGVLLVVQAVAKTNGGPDFSAWIYDDEAVANTAYHSDTHPLELSLDEMKAFSLQEERHLLLDYQGGWDATNAHPSTADAAYTITWFSAAGSPHPVVGKYSSEPEQWKP
ncbi:hypothetical protein [Mycobacterium paragordonae]|uniref:Uncharacterized protein n=1 Tax=Mycobacterium paragordonae TaxID=1389713 RepID=A0AAJ1S0D9_9MYCO|nr:hypothetical protein [Mycobacterium paragordonae]MDP7735120.1 hypothetical protein [Mycobacterium paragordonae]